MCVDLAALQDLLPFQWEPLDAVFDPLVLRPPKHCPLGY